LPSLGVVSFIVCVVLCAVLCLSVVCYFVWCVTCELCLIVVPLPPGKNPFAVKISNNSNNNNNEIITLGWINQTILSHLIDLNFKPKYDKCDGPEWIQLKVEVLLMLVSA
jgi:hypothetical protein